MIPAVRAKICCIASEKEAQVAAQAGAYAIGLVSAMPSGPGPIDEETIARIAAAASLHVSTFLLTSLTDPAGIAAQYERCGTDTVQLCRALSPAAHAELRKLLPSVRLVQVIHVEDETALSQAEAVADAVDFLLLDTGRPRAAVPELGGTGRTHDWQISRRIVKRTRTPVFLAGGLTPDNVGDAIRVVQPYGVDVCTGVRTDGMLDEAKVTAFVAAVEAASRRR